jgi:hypothetical protein
LPSAVSGANVPLITTRDSPPAAGVPYSAKSKRSSMGMMVVVEVGLRTPAVAVRTMYSVNAACVDVTMGPHMRVSSSRRAGGSAAILRTVASGSKMARLTWSLISTSRR